MSSISNNNNNHNTSCNSSQFRRQSSSRSSGQGIRPHHHNHHLIHNAHHHHPSRRFSHQTSIQSRDSIVSDKIPTEGHSTVAIVAPKDPEADKESSSSERGEWGSRWEFLLSCVGLSVGIGNVWRFPYLAYENGGGAFLIPYLIMLMLAGKPIYFMELCLGQFVGRGPLCVWQCAPIAKGVGIAMVSCCLVVCVYYNMVISYCLYYMVSVFRWGLPWTTCDGDWAIGSDCVVRSQNSSNENIFIGRSSSQVFWENKVLETTDSIDDLGGIKWDLTACLLASWIITILCLLRGVKTSGKVVYFAATFPYLILVSLMLVGFTRPGAWQGIKYFLMPSWDKLLSFKVWIAAASQMFFSLGVTIGALIMYSSYNNFTHDVFHDAMIVSTLDTVTSIIAGLVIFSGLGAMAHNLNVEVKDVVKGGPGLAFVVYPEALSKLPLAEVWSVLFFFMLFILGMDSEFALLESVLTSLADEFQIVRAHRLKFCVGLGALCFLAGIPCATRGGQYVLEIFDHYGGGLPLVYIALAECTALIWLYGYQKFSYDIYYMLDRRLGWYWKLTWKYTGPGVLLVLAVSSFILHKPLTLGDYAFPLWANVVGWTLTLSILAVIPGFAVYKVFTERETKGLLDKIKQASIENEREWGPQDPEVRKDWQSKRSGLNSVFMGVKSDLYDSKQPATLKGFSMNSIANDNHAFKGEEG
ncbi:sodium-dependent proline transporter-like isoform X1 [Brevipalpus obovatus]|uniref:sodium-dependent proline transporter-like isoform X1 n=1 Tax=Brevipalpus obovatus TaxID=246614 RepID=UPI003D9E5EC0